MEPIKVLILTLSDLAGGGASKAAFNLSKQLKKIGVASRLLVRIKVSKDNDVIGPESRIGTFWGKLRIRIDKLSLIFSKYQSHGFWSTNWLKSSILTNNIDYDILQLNWIGGGVVSIKELEKISVPVVWRLPDMWAFTGGCHYDDDCGRYKSGCGYCPNLGNNGKNDLSKKNLQKKLEHWKNLNLTIVAPSKWLYECVKSSLLFKDVPVKIIPTGVNIEKFTPMNRDAAMKRFGINEKKKIILFGAVGAKSDERKGSEQLIKSLVNLYSEENTDKYQLVVFGAKEQDFLSEVGFETTCLGIVKDEKILNEIYSMADVFVAPSLQENLANTVLESLASGTPCVAFDVGGMPDMISHKENGYLACHKDVADLANGIEWVLNNNENDVLGIFSRKVAVERFSHFQQAEKYKILYEELIKNSENE